MNAGKWMLHLDLTCGSVEYAGGEPPADALARVVGVLREHGLLLGPGAADGCQRQQQQEGETA